MLVLSVFSVAAVIAYAAPVFEVHAEPITIAEGQPIFIDVTVTYGGRRPLVIHADSYQTPCFVNSLPDDWHPILKKRGPYLIFVTGCQSAGVYPGDRLERRVDVGKQFYYSAPVGQYIVKIHTMISRFDALTLQSHRIWESTTDVPVRVYSTRAEGPRLRPFAGGDLTARSLADQLTGADGRR